MFGAHADDFFLKQKGERVVAQKANGRSNSLTWPDRGDRGSQSTFTVPGQYETPGPQNYHVQNEMMPGMGCNEMMPGMGGSEMMPGMGGSEMMPGMGGIEVKNAFLILGAFVAAGLILSKRK